MYLVVCDHTGGTAWMKILTDAGCAGCRAQAQLLPTRTEFWGPIKSDAINEKNALSSSSFSVRHTIDLFVLRIDAEDRTFSP